MRWLRTLRVGLGRRFSLGSEELAPVSDAHAGTSSPMIGNDGGNELGATAAIISNEPRSEHCPFINLADERCAEYFNLDRMEYALEHCFDRYEACALHRQLMAERSGELVTAGAVGDDSIRRNLVQVTVNVSGPRADRPSGAAKSARFANHSA